MRSYFLLYLLLLLSKSSIAQPNSASYVFEVNFYPSFDKPSKLILQSNGNSVTLSYSILDNKGERLLTENKKVIKHQYVKDFEVFIQTYKFAIKNNIDTIYDVEIVKGDSVQSYLLSLGNDGITVKGTYSSNSATKHFAFWSPKKGSQNAELFNILNYMVENSIFDKKVVKYQERLQQYFPHNVGLKKVSDNPLTYKLYGSISVDDAQEIEDFLASLPDKEKVIIDMSNFQSIGTLFYDEFEEYCVGKKNIYWVNPSSNARAILKSIGIKRRYIISQKM